MGPAGGQIAVSLPAMPDRPLALAALAVWVLTASLGAFMLTRWIRRGALRRPPAEAGQQPAGLPPGVIFSHMGLAVTGLLVWAGFVVSGTDAVGWLAAAMLLPAIGLGISTVTIWTPYPAYPPPAAEGGPPGGPGGTRPGTSRGYVTGPAGGMLAGPAENALARRLTDEILARALTDKALAGRLTEEVLTSIPPGPPGQGGRKPAGHMAPLVPFVHGMGAVTTFLLVILSAIGAR